jgi:hypothetical protein
MGESFSQKNKKVERERQRDEQIYAKVLGGFTKDECGIRN